MTHSAQRYLFTNFISPAGTLFSYFCTMSIARDTKPHIGIFGRRNSGKSSLINALTGQDIAIVSEVAGTTTDPVKKSMEIFGIGPAIVIDTAGIDDSGEAERGIRASVVHDIHCGP